MIAVLRRQSTVLKEERIITVHCPLVTGYYLLFTDSLAPEERILC